MTENVLTKTGNLGVVLGWGKVMDSLFRHIEFEMSVGSKWRELFNKQLDV